MAKWGLRKKSLMALLLACVVALAPAALIGWQVLDGSGNTSDGPTPIISRS